MTRRDNVCSQGHANGMMRKAILGMVLVAVVAGVLGLGATKAYAGEADIKLPPLHEVKFFDGKVHGDWLMWAGLGVCVIGLIFGLAQYAQIKKMALHSSMSNVSDTIWETCKTYLLQQGKFLV